MLMFCNEWGEAAGERLLPKNTSSRIWHQLGMQVRYHSVDSFPC